MDGCMDYSRARLRRIHLFSWPVSFGENWYSKMYAGHHLKEMVLKIYDVQKAVKKNPPNPRNIWRALNNHCKVTTFRAILATDFEKAMKFLRQRLKIENSSPSAATKNPNWREEQYRSIHSIAKRCGLEERLLNYMKRNFHVEHLRELQNDELMRVYRYIVGAKSRMKNPS